MKPRKKSMPIALLLWFFLGFLAAHKIYLGKVQEAIRLILLYFFVPLLSVVASILILKSFGMLNFPKKLGPADLPALIQDPAFIAMAATAFIVLAAIWVWDLIILIKEVREHNERAAAESSVPIGAQEDPL
ncbi:MAG: NINE protein [Nitrospinaceae bacterium]|jgi:hypothetical protein|nr:NINE protein [Nitrospinaceae bacterium]